MSKAPVHNFKIVQGSDDAWNVQFMIDSETPRPLTDAVIECQLRQRPLGALVDTLTLANDRIEVLDEEEGKIKLIFPASITSAYKIFSGSYDIEMTKDGETKRRLQGEWSLDLETTKI